MKKLIRFLLVTILGQFLFFSISSAYAEGRVALVIGNQDYQQKGAGLQRPLEDAKSIAKALSEHQFTLVDNKALQNLSKKEMKNALLNFQQLASKADVALLYYAGHGAQDKDKNYLVPVDANIRNAAEISDQTVDLQLAMDTLQEAGAKMNLVFLDACRNNPFGTKRSMLSRGLTRIDSQSMETLISYSTSKDKTADDNSPYTPALVSLMEQQPNLKIETLLTAVAAMVKNKSNKEQQPEYTSSLTSSFCFGKCDDSWLPTPIALPINQSKTGENIDGMFLLVVLGTVVGAMKGWKEKRIIGAFILAVVGAAAWIISLVIGSVTAKPIIEVISKLTHGILGVVTSEIVVWAMVWAIALAVSGAMFEVIKGWGKSKINDVLIGMIAGMKSGVVGGVIVGTIVGVVVGSLEAGIGVVICISAGSAIYGLKEDGFNGAILGAFSGMIVGGVINEIGRWG